MAAVPLRAAGKLRVGVGAYSFHTYSMDDMIVQLKALNATEIEMSRGEFMLMNHPSDDSVRSAREKLDSAGIQCISYYSATIKDEEDLGNAVRFAKLLGVKHISGDATGGILKQIDSRLTSEGLTFGIHNHFFPGQRFAYESPEDVLRAVEGLSSTVGATADVGHFASCGYDTVDSLRKLKSRLKLVHLKDVQASGGEVNVLLGKGISKIPQVMQELQRQNFAGLVAIEYEKEGDVNADMRYDMEFARKLA